MENKDTKMRDCTDCEYADFESSDLGRCLIDNITNIRWYCCTPAKDIKSYAEWRKNKGDTDE